MTIPDEIEELLGAYALDAVDDDERRQVEELPAPPNPRARAEVDEHREVATLLAFSGARAPEGLWDRIAGALEERAPAPGPSWPRCCPPRRRRWPTAAVVGAARSRRLPRLVVITVVARARRRSTRPSSTAWRRCFDRAMADPDATRVVLKQRGRDPAAVAVVELGGLGVIFLARAGRPRPRPHLPAVGRHRRPGRSPSACSATAGVDPFTVDGNLTTLVVTDEAAGGVPTSQQPALLTGTVA